MHILPGLEKPQQGPVYYHGKIVEDGAYDELIALNGQFAELVERQRLVK